jgi:hypothetical protein
LTVTHGGKKSNAGRVSYLWRRAMSLNLSDVEPDSRYSILDPPAPGQAGKQVEAEQGSRGAGEQGSRGAGEQGSRGNPLLIMVCTPFPPFSLSPSLRCPPFPSLHSKSLHDAYDGRRGKQR